MNDSNSARDDPIRAGDGRRPRIGITTYRQPARWGAWEESAALLSGTYVDCVVAAGGTPLLLPPTGTDPSVVEDLDGLVIAGGSDVGAERYGADPHPLTQSQAHRDDHDFALATAAMDARLPLFPICRGLQVLNAVLGGTLIQHLPDVLGVNRYQAEPGVFHRIRIETVGGSEVSQVLGPVAEVSVYHHQAVDLVGRGLTVTARAEDGTIEALEFDPREDRGWMIAVQWHPERDLDDLRLFESFVAAAREYRLSRLNDRLQLRSPTP